MKSPTKHNYLPRWWFCLLCVLSLSLGLSLSKAAAISSSASAFFANSVGPKPVEVATPELAEVVSPETVEGAVQETLGDPLGDFAYGYDGLTARILSVRHSFSGVNGLRTDLGYAHKTAGGQERELPFLEHITHSVPSGTVAQHHYLRNENGWIDLWQQHDGSQWQSHDYRYDQAGQLETARTYDGLDANSPLLEQSSGRSPGREVRPAISQPAQTHSNHRQSLSTLPCIRGSNYDKVEERFRGHVSIGEYEGHR